MKHYPGNSAVYTSKVITAAQHDIVVTGSVLNTPKGIYINTSFTDLLTGHDNIKNTMIHGWARMEN